MLAVYPGTFDPLTNSHSEIIKRTAGIFESVVVAVAGDTSKNTLFSLDERVAMVQDELSQINCKNLRVTAFHGLLVTFASQNNIKVIVRGLRALSDFEYEFKMAYMNKKLDSTIETIFIPATEKENFISSSFVKEIARLNGDVGDLVPLHVQKKLQSVFAIKKTHT